MQSPEMFVTDFPTTIYCCVDTTKPAVLDGTHRISIGYETYFFSSEAAKGEFEREISRYCGAITDPVTKERFFPELDCARAMHKERLYLFASDSTKSVFEMMPEMYEDPKYAMIRIDSTATQ